MDILKIHFNKNSAVSLPVGLFSELIQILNIIYSTE